MGTEDVSQGGKGCQEEDEKCQKSKGREKGNRLVKGRVDLETESKN